MTIKGIVQLGLIHRETGEYLGTSAPFWIPSRVAYVIKTPAGWQEIPNPDLALLGYAPACKSMETTGAPKPSNAKTFAMGQLNPLGIEDAPS